MQASGKKESSSHITVKFRSQDDTCVFFRVKRDVELRRMMEAFSEKVGKEMSTLRFVFDGIRVKPNQTPNELELEDGDEIDAFGDQIGGLSFSYRHQHYLS